MKLDLIKYSLSNLRTRKLRTFLTVLSIFIGIMAIFALLSFGQGLGSYVDRLGKEMGADKLIIQPKGFGPPGSGSVSFSREDVDFIRKINGVAEAAPLMMGMTYVTFKSETKPRYVYAWGVPYGDEWSLVKEASTLKIDKGRELKKQDKFKAVIGYNYQIPDKVFNKAVRLGDKISIGGYMFEVVGFYQLIGNPQDDKTVSIPEDTAKTVLNRNDSYEFIYVRSAINEDPKEVAKKVQEKFRKHKGQKEGQEDFFVQTFEQLIETFGSVLLVINGVLVIIALISLIVAAVNIMNTMYTAILERTKEIGIMKAIGSRNSDILFVFVFESALLGFLGALLGIISGYGVAKFGGYMAASAGLALLQPAFPWWLTAGSLLFGILVGGLSGIVPAIQASRKSLLTHCVTSSKGDN